MKFITTNRGHKQLFENFEGFVRAIGNRIDAALYLVTALTHIISYYSMLSHILLTQFIITGHCAWGIILDSHMYS